MKFTTILCLVGVTAAVSAAPVAISGNPPKDGYPFLSRVAEHKKCGAYRAFGCTVKVELTHGQDFDEKYERCMKKHNCECAFDPIKNCAGKPRDQEDE